VVSMDGGTPQKIVDKDTGSATWSPDGNILALSFYTRTGPFLATYDLRSGKLSQLPSSTGLIGAQWLMQDTLIAAARHPARTARQVRVVANPPPAKGSRVRRV